MVVLWSGSQQTRDLSVGLGHGTRLYLLSRYPLSHHILVIEDTCILSYPSFVFSLRNQHLAISPIQRRSICWCLCI